MRRLGFTEDELRLLTADEARRYLRATDVRSGIFFAPSAALQPARLVTALAEIVEARGVAVLEQTAVTAMEAGVVRTDRGIVKAPVAVRATEAYTRDLADRTTFADDRLMVIYGQRTADNRIAFGGRGVPYLFGSRIAESAELHEPSHELIRETLVELLPVLADTTITHRWGGVLGIPRNWVPGVTLDRSRGQGTLGGYVGEGVVAANLGGRTMAELILGEATERTTLPWVGATARRWEPNHCGGSGFEAVAESLPPPTIGRRGPARRLPWPTRCPVSCAAGVSRKSIGPQAS